MKKVALFNKLNKPNLTAEESNKLIDLFLKTNKSCKLVEYGGNGNNMTIAGISSDPTRAIAERLTNGMDAIIEHWVEENPEFAAASSPKDLINNYKGINVENMKTNAIRELGRSLVVLEIDKCDNDYNVSVIDYGIGITPSDMPNTILSLNRNNKKGKPYTHGHYGMGGASSLIYTKGATFIASRRQGSDIIGFTVVVEREDYEVYNEPVFMVLVDAETELPLTIDATTLRSPIKHGTKITMFGYQSTAVESSGSDGPYFIIRRLLPASELPIGLNDRRRIGAAKKKDSAEASSSKFSYGSFKTLQQKSNADVATIAEHEKMEYMSTPFMIDIGDGSVTVQTFVIKKSLRGDGKPIHNFFPDSSNVVITNNGQNQHEFNGKNKILAKFQYLQTQMAVHINADNLTTKQKSKFFVSTRESARTGEILETIRKEVIQYLTDDDILKGLEEEAERKAHGNSQIENAGFKDIYIALGIGKGGKTKTGKTGKEDKEIRKPPTRWIMSPLTDKPNQLNFVNASIKISEKSNRKYVLVTTDAANHFHDKIDFHLVDSVGNIKISRWSELANGRTTVTLDCSDAKLGDRATLVATIKAPGINLAAECELSVFVGGNARTPKNSNPKGSGIPEVKPYIVSDGSDADTKNALLAVSNEPNPTLENTFVRLIFKDDYIDMYYSIEAALIKRCMNKVGKTKAAHDKFKETYQKQLSILAVQSMNNGKEQISSSMAEAMAIIAFSSAKDHI